MKYDNQEIQVGHHLTFRLSGEQYAISIRTVREVIEYDSVRPVPGTPEYVRGVINLRGTVVPVVDLAMKLNLPQTPITKDTCIIILDVMIDGEPGSMGVITEAVNEVLELTPDDIESPPAFGTQVHVNYLVGMTMLESKMALVLDIDAALQTSEFSASLDQSPHGHASPPGYKAEHEREYAASASRSRAKKQAPKTNTGPGRQSEGRQKDYPPPPKNKTEEVLHTSRKERIVEPQKYPQKAPHGEPRAPIETNGAELTSTDSPALPPTDVRADPRPAVGPPEVTEKHLDTKKEGAQESESVEPVVLVKSFPKSEGEEPTDGGPVKPAKAGKELELPLKMKGDLPPTAVLTKPAEESREVESPTKREGSEPSGTEPTKPATEFALPKSESEQQPGELPTNAYRELDSALESKDELSKDTADEPSPNSAGTDKSSMDPKSSPKSERDAKSAEFGKPNHKSDGEESLKKTTKLSLESEVQPASENAVQKRESGDQPSAGKQLEGDTSGSSPAEATSTQPADGKTPKADLPKIEVAKPNRISRDSQTPDGSSQSAEDERGEQRERLHQSKPAGVSSMSKSSTKGEVRKPTKASKDGDKPR